MTLKLCLCNIHAKHADDMYCHFLIGSRHAIDGISSLLQPLHKSNCALAHRVTFKLTSFNVAFNSRGENSQKVHCRPVEIVHLMSPLAGAQ